MRTETTATEVETPRGSLYVTVRHARLDEWHEHGKGNTSALRPRLFVSSAPEFEAGPSASEHWKIRGRMYGVQRVLYFHDRTEHGDDRWHKDNRDWSGDGYRDDRNGQVKFMSATWDAIDAAVTAGMDAFTELHPAWVQLSEYLYYTGVADSERNKAEGLRNDAARHEHTARTMSSMGDQRMSRIPGALFDTVL